MLIVYTDICTPCKYRYEMEYIHEIARARGAKVLIKEVKFRPDLKAEAEALTDLPIPFVYNDETKVTSVLKSVRGSSI